MQVDGVPASQDAAVAVCAKAAVHLDASVAATWSAGSSVDADGRTRVTQWADVRGTEAGAEVWDNSGDATASHVKDVQPPFVSASRSSTGLTLLDFGERAADSVGTYGPQALMRLKTRIAAAQEIFFVAALNDGSQVVGDASDYSFQTSEQYVFSYGADILKDGSFARFNGNRNWQDVATVGGLDRMVRTFDSYTASAHDLMLTNVRLGEGNAKPIRYLASDRLYAMNSGGVKIGELIVFTAALTDDERAAVTDYLMRKWFAAAAHDDFALVDAADGTSLTVPAGRVARIGTLRVNGTTFTKKGAGTLQVGRVYPEGLTITVEGGDVKLNTQVASEAAVTAPVGTPQIWLDADAATAFETDGADVTAWNDRRGNGLKATRLAFDEITAFPSADAATLAGHTVLTFPDKAAFELPAGGQRETFVVFSFPDDVQHYNAIGNGYTTDREGALFAADHRIDHAAKRRWSVARPTAGTVEPVIYLLGGSAPYDDPDAVPVMGGADAAAMSVKTSDRRIEAAVASVAEKGRGDCLRLTAVNRAKTRAKTWAHAALKFPQAKDASPSDGVGFWVKGDGTGAMLNVSLRGHGPQDCLVRLDFGGWRYFTFHYDERDCQTWSQYRWPISDGQYTTRFSPKAVSAVDVMLADIPVEGEKNVFLDANADAARAARASRTASRTGSRRSAST